MVEFTSESGSKLRGEWERLCDQAVQYTNEWDTGAYYILLLTQNAKLRRYLSVCSDRSLGRSLGHRVILLAGGAVLHGPPGFVLCWAACIFVSPCIARLCCIQNFRRFDPICVMRGVWFYLCGWSFIRRSWTKGWFSTGDDFHFLCHNNADL